MYFPSPSWLENWQLLLLFMSFHFYYFLSIFLETLSVSLSHTHSHTHTPFYIHIPEIYSFFFFFFNPLPFLHYSKRPPPRWLSLSSGWSNLFSVAFCCSFKVLFTQAFLFHSFPSFVFFFLSWCFVVILQFIELLQNEHFKFLDRKWTLTFGAEILEINPLPLRCGSLMTYDPEGLARVFMLLKDTHHFQV